MKIRSGFVSNSSSSSFIIGYGVIKDNDKLNEYLEKNKIKLRVSWYDGVTIKKQGEVFKKDKFYNEDEQLLQVTNYKNIKIPEEINKKHDVLIVRICNDEGDEMFYDEEFEELNYEKAEIINFYNDEQKAIIRLFYEKDIIDQSKYQLIFGAERSG
jgi:hypothetical protein